MLRAVEDRPWVLPRRMCPARVDPGWTAEVFDEGFDVEVCARLRLWVMRFFFQWSRLIKRLLD